MWPLRTDNVASATKEWNVLFYPLVTHGHHHTGLMATTSDGLAGPWLFALFPSREPYFRFHNPRNPPSSFLSSFSSTTCFCTSCPLPSQMRRGFQLCIQPSPETSQQRPPLLSCSLPPMLPCGSACPFTATFPERPVHVSLVPPSAGGLQSPPPLLPDALAKLPAASLLPNPSRHFSCILLGLSASDTVDQVSFTERFPSSSFQDPPSPDFPVSLAWGKIQVSTAALAWSLCVLGQVA